MFEDVAQNTKVAERIACTEGNFYRSAEEKIGPGMNERVQRLRKLSYVTEPSLSIERALHETEFYKENFGKYSYPVMRALNFLDHCTRKTIYLGNDELIVGERGPKPKAVPTFPELTCHSVEDFKVLNKREKQRVNTEKGDKEQKEINKYFCGVPLSGFHNH